MGLLRQVVNQYQKYTFDIATKNLIYHWKTRERCKSFGKNNPDKQFYVIRSLDDTSKYYIGPRHNLMANYFYVLSHLAYAQKHNLQPVVDQLNYPVYISQSTSVHGSYNPWEYFWEQPDGISLDEVYSSKNVILSKQNWHWQWDMGYNVENYTNEGLIAQYYALSELVPLNKTMRMYCDNIKQALFSKNKKILGVSVRVAGHSEIAYFQGPGHPKQPSAEEMIQLVESRLVAWDMDKVFLATDSDYAVELFRKAFGKQLIIMVRMRSPIGYDQKKDGLKPMYASENIIQTTKDYIAEMELLAYCNGLLGTVSSGLRYAVVQNNMNYKHIEILDYGRFEDKRKRKFKI